DAAAVPGAGAPPAPGRPSATARAPSAGEAVGRDAARRSDHLGGERSGGARRAVDGPRLAGRRVRGTAVPGRRGARSPASDALAGGYPAAAGAAGSAGAVPRPLAGGATAAHGQA